MVEISVMRRDPLLWVGVMMRFMSETCRSAQSVPKGAVQVKLCYIGTGWKRVSLANLVHLIDYLNVC